MLEKKKKGYKMEEVENNIFVNSNNSVNVMLIELILISKFNVFRASLYHEGCTVSIR